MDYKKEEFIPFTNDFMFSLVMRDKEICMDFLNLILPDEEFTDARIEDSGFDELIEDISTQAYLKFAELAKGVRFDVYMNSRKAWAAVEMQTYVENNIPKRSRYYQANMDIDALNKGKAYDELPKEYVIFICTYDFIGMDEPVYYFENIEKNLGLPFGDETYKIVLNTKCSPEKIPEKLRPLYEYINNPETKNQDDLVKKVDKQVRKYNDNEWRRKLMTLEDLMNRNYKIGLKEGRKEGLEEGLEEGLKEGRSQTLKSIALKLKESGMPNLKIMEFTGLTESEINSL